MKLGDNGYPLVQVISPDVDNRLIKGGGHTGYQLSVVGITNDFGYISDINQSDLVTFFMTYKYNTRKWLIIRFFFNIYLLYLHLLQKSISVVDK